MNGHYYKKLTSQEKLVVENQVSTQGKNVIVAYLLGWFLIGTGASHFYIGNKSKGNTQLWLFIIGILTSFIFIGVIPLMITTIWGIVDLFTLGSDVNAQNSILREQLSEQLFITKNGVRGFGDDTDEFEKNLDKRIKQKEQEISQNKSVEEKLAKLKELEEFENRAKEIEDADVSLTNSISDLSEKTTEEITNEIFSELEDKHK